MTPLGFVVIGGRRLVGVTHEGDGVYLWHFEDAVRDVSNVRGPQPRIQRRGPITDFIYFDGGLARVKCVHGKSWPEGDWCEGYAPRGRACPVCVGEWHEARRAA
jgi:hypothetical protein